MAKDPAIGPITRYDETGRSKVMAEPAAEETQPTEGEMTEKAADPEIEFHDHETPKAYSMQDAYTELKDKTYNELKDLCEVDNLTPARSKSQTIDIILSHWFATPPEPVKEDALPEMSARIKRIRGLL